MTAVGGKLLFRACGAVARSSSRRGRARRSVRWAAARAARHAWPSAARGLHLLLRLLERERLVGRDLLLGAQREPVHLVDRPDVDDPGLGVVERLHAVAQGLQRIALLGLVLRRLDLVSGDGRQFRVVAVEAGVPPQDLVAEHARDGAVLPALVDAHLVLDLGSGARSALHLGREVLPEDRHGDVGIEFTLEELERVEGARDRLDQLEIVLLSVGRRRLRKRNDGVAAAGND